jgi:protein-tyrosine-phosphatase
MAEGLLKSLWSKFIDSQPFIHSAGTHAMEGLPAEPYAVEALKIFGIDISAHRSRPLDSTITNKADLILVMAKQHLDFVQNYTRDQSANVHLLCGVGVGSEPAEVPDPYGGSLRTYHECARMIHGCLEQVMIHLKGRSDR